MLHKLLMGLLLAGLTAIAAAETVYKWLDTSGQVHYTDLPPRQAGAKIVGVYEQEAGVIADEGSDQSDYSDDAGDDSSEPETTPTEEPPVSEEAMAAVQDDVAREKVVQCKEAQDRYQRYIESRRLFREKDGRREYLTDQELTEARARAKQTVDEYCS
ncbi:MAG: DUF4124 domain-containing protein [Steroidobacteraceae bacterium]